MEIFRAVTNRDTRQWHELVGTGKGAEGLIRVQGDKRPARRTLWDANPDSHPRKIFADRGGLAIVSAEVDPDLFAPYSRRSKDLLCPGRDAEISVRVVHTLRRIHRLVDYQAPVLSTHPTQDYEEGLAGEPPQHTVHVSKDLHGALSQLQVAVLFDCQAEVGDTIATVRKDGRGGAIEWICTDGPLHCHSIWNIANELMDSVDSIQARLLVATAQSMCLDGPISSTPMVVVTRKPR